MVNTRREFLAASALTGAGVLLAGSPATAAAKGRRVAILGGGVAGLSAALELAERGFAVTVYERLALGGKARSMAAPGSGLPGEHGFRFFPGFYKNLTDTMRRIPFAGNAKGTWDNLVRATTYMGSRSGGRPDLTVPFPLPFPPVPVPFTPETFMASVASGLGTTLRIPPQEATYAARKGWVYFTSCDERRIGQWDKVSWNDFMRADKMSDEYQKFLADGMIRNLAAMKSKDASTHSIGLVGEVTGWSGLGRGNEPNASVDRVLNGSTSEMLIDPWVARLKKLGVVFQVGWAAESLQVSGHRVTGAVVRNAAGQRQQVTADWFLSAMPVERFTKLLSPQVIAADPHLARSKRLRTDWMTGLMFYLKKELPLTPGHVNYVDSTWAITSISQAQFWKRPFTQFGDHTVRECLSTIISDWFTPGTFNKKAAKDCTPKQIARETWQQIKAHLNDTGKTVLRDDMLHSWFLDPGIIPAGGGVTNETPLFIQSPGSWADRPESKTGIQNLFLSGDWVKTNINVTTMEGANEGARQAVNALLDAAGSHAPRCKLGELYKAPEFEGWKALDRDRYRRRQPNVFDTQAPMAP